MANDVPDFSLSEESKAVIKDILTSKSKENQGIINLDELGECLEAFGFDADEDDIEFLTKHLDDNGDGELEVSELMDNIDVINWHCFFGKELMKQFCKIDTDGDGVIRYPEMLRVLLTRGNNPMKPQEGRVLLDKLARQFDANFDGKFSYAEFVKIWMSDLLPFKNTLGNSGEQESDEEGKKAEKQLEKPKKKISKKKSSTLSNGGAGSLPPEPRPLKSGYGSRYSPANLYGPKPGNATGSRPTGQSSRPGIPTSKGKSTKPKPH